jgi:hypothetical protein
MAEENIINVVDIASKGVVIDTPPIALSPNIFSDVRNVRFKDGAIKKIEGELLLNNITSDLTGSGQAFGKVRYLAVWQNPNRTPYGCYYIFVVDYVLNSVTVGQKIYIQDHLGTKRDITPAGLNSGNGFTYTPSKWQHTLFSGGFVFIINNGLDKPHYILDTAGNTDIANITLAELPGWDSYHVNQLVVSDTWNTGEQEVFDVGQKINFALNSVTVTVAGAARTAEAGTPAGTNTTNGTTFIPGTYPGYASLPTVNASKFQIYTDTNTNTTIIYVGGLADGNTATVNILSRNPVTVTAGVIESFGNLLVAGDLTEKDSNSIVRRLSGVVRTSDVAVPGAIPNNWNPFAAGVSTADEFTLSETNVITAMKSLQSNLYIYSTDSIHAMRLTGNINAPVSFSPVTDEYGALSAHSVIEYDGKHFVIGGNDVYLFAGNPGDIQSLADGRIRNYFFNNFNPVYEQQMFTILNHSKNEIWINYPTLASLTGECDEALIYNYRDNTWTIRDLDSVTAGDTGPAKGGGIPAATIALTGNSGNAGYTNRGKKEIQAVTINGGTPKKTIGTKAIKTVAVDTFTTFTTDTLERIDLTLTGDSGPNTVVPISTLTFSSTATFTYDRDKTTYLDGGASVVITGDASIGTVNLPASSLLGTSQVDGATITMTILVAAVKDYVNANNALADWTATATTNVLKLTSDVPGPRSFSTSSLAIGGGSTTSITVASTQTGVGVYGITAALSPAIIMRITAPAVGGLQSAIDETITFAKGKNSQALLAADAVTLLQAKTVFNGSSSSIYSVSNVSNVLKFVSRLGGDHSALTITFKTAYSGTDYAETTFGGNVSSTVNVTTAGVNRSIPPVTMTLTFPAGNTSLKYLEGVFSRANIVTELDTLIDADSNWTGATGTGIVTATAGAIGVQTNNFGVALTSIGTIPSGFVNGTFTGAETRAGRAAHSTTDTITLTPPLGSVVVVNFDGTTAFDPDSGSSPTNVETITATEIATAIEAAWTDTTHFTVARANAVLTFTSVLRTNVDGAFAYSVVTGTSRTGTLVTPLITNSVGGNIVVTEGITAIYAKMTRVTITLNSTAGSQVIFDRHYGEGPGRLLDPNFTAAANDLPYGDSGAANAAAYLAIYYDPDKTQSGTELGKPNGTVSNTLTAMQLALSTISSNQFILVVPNSTSSPTSIQISPSQFSSSANYVTIFSPATQVVAASVGPTTTALTNAAEGTTVAAGNPTQSTSGTTISTTFDIIRPWNSINVNPNKTFPIFAESGYTSNTLFNRIRAADLGYDFGGTNYISYFEKQQMSITPNFDTETIDTVALWADGGTIETVGGEPQRATLQVRARGTNYPGENPYLTVAEDNNQTNAKRNKLVVNDFVIASAYKVDTRIQGRIMNYRVDDATASTASGYIAANNKAWNVSGLQLAISKKGVR